MSAISYFDAYCTIGRTLRWAPGMPETAEQILAAMDHFGIHEALVVDSLCASTDPPAGNERVLQRIQAHPRLHAAWAGLMTGSRELPPPEQLLERMRAESVRALFLFYGQFDIRLDEWGVDDLLEPFAEARAPVFFCPTKLLDAGRVDATDWANIVRICRRFSELPIVVSESRIYGGQRSLYQALDRCPNLHVDLTAIWLHKRIEFICREFGADRLVWSSRLPEFSPAAPLTQINCSGISADDLALIAGGNLRRLLSWHEPTPPVEVDLPAPIDSLHRKARERISLSDERFHDCHGHLGWCSNRHVVHETPEGLVAEMDKFGIRAGCVFSFAGAMVDEDFGNDRAFEMVSRFPERFLGFTLINPHRGEAEIIRQLELGFDRGFRGIKLATAFQQAPPDHPGVDVACRFADEHGLLMLNHVWGSVENMRRLCTSYPNATFITGHTTLEFAGLTREVDNLYICTCPIHAWNQVEEYVAAYGADRLLFGSDLTDLPIGWGLGPILYARISESDKRLILGENLVRLLQGLSD